MCGAIDDYCSLRGAQGVEIDCRSLSDLLTDEQAASVLELMAPEWWLEAQRDL